MNKGEQPASLHPTGPHFVSVICIRHRDMLPIRSWFSTINDSKCSMESQENISPPDGFRYGLLSMEIAVMEIWLKPSWRVVSTVLRRRSLKRATDEQRAYVPSHVMKYHSRFPLTPGSRGVKINTYSTRSVSNNIFCTTNIHSIRITIKSLKWLLQDH